MPADYDCWIAQGGSADDGAELTKAFRDYRAVRVVGALYIRTPIIMPQFGRLYSENNQYMIKRGNGPMLILDSYAETYGLWWEGQAADYDGPIILFPPDSNRQRVGKGLYMRSRGPCLDMSTHSAGAYATIADSIIQRADLSPAIVMPQEEQGTTGICRIHNCSGAGGVLLDLGNSNVTKIEECDTAGILFGEACQNAALLNNRLAGQKYDVRGTLHTFGYNKSSAAWSFYGGGHVYPRTNYDAGRTIEPGTTYCYVEQHPSCPKTVNNSGNSTNTIT